MNQDFLSRAASLIVRMYDLVLYLYPSPFRREYAPHMRQVFRDMIREAAGASGWIGLLHLCGRTIIDVLQTLIYEHYTVLMEISPRKLATYSSFGAFYLAALPLWVVAANYLVGVDYRPFFILFAVPAFWGIPIMVLGISGQLLPNQRYTTVPYLVVSIVVIAYIILMGSREVVDIDIVRSWGITDRGLNRVFWGGIALLGGMAWSQQERKLGGTLISVAALYFAMSFGGVTNWFFLPFIAALVGGFTYVGVWLRKRKDHSVLGKFALSWWAVSLQGVILILGLVAVLLSSQRPLRNTASYKMAAGFFPEYEVLAYDDNKARAEIEQFIGKPLPANAYDINMEYTPQDRGGHWVHIRFSAEPEEVRKLIDSGVLCFDADLNDIPLAEEIPIINDVIKEGRYEQEPNPWHASEPWWWVRNSYHIKGFCPMPSRYGLEIFQHSPESWWVSIWGGHR